MANRNSSLISAATLQFQLQITTYSIANGGRRLIKKQEEVKKWLWVGDGVTLPL